MAASVSTDLNSAQLAAVESIEGPLLIIAGPGSGKTKTLVERIVYLINKGVPAENLLVATFTEKAAKELMTRVSNRLLELDYKVNLNEMYIGTLHSIFLRILEEFREFTRLKRSYRILDDFDQQYFIYRNIKEYDDVEGASQLIGDHTVPRWKRAERLIGLLAKISEECLQPTQLQEAIEPEVKILGEFYQIYIKHLTEENVLDFSAIQTEVLFLLENQPQVLLKLQDKIRYLMIDEYQDTNTIQERILFKLAERQHNICVVGDDDQGLYRFRGATIRNILEFPTNFPAGSCKQITLTTNYRSHPGIIDFYNRWMDACNWADKGVTYRYPKTIVPRAGAFPVFPSVVKVSSGGSWDAYYEEVYQFIKTLEQQGILTDYNQIAFLFKSVRHERVVELATYLEDRGIPVFSPRSDLFFEREEIQLAIGALVFIFPTLADELRWDENAQLSIWDYYEHCKRRFAQVIRQDTTRHSGLLKWAQSKAKAHLTLTKNTNYGFAALFYQVLEYPMFADYLTIDLKASKTSAQWLDKQAELLLADGVDSVLANLAELSRLSADATECRRRLVGYYSRNRHRMQYGTFRKRGLQIGSGPMEAAHRTVVQCRMKRSGQRWSDEGAQAMLNLRVAYKSDRWELVTNSLSKR